jgi:hypothetical protein
MSRDESPGEILERVRLEREGAERKPSPPRVAVAVTGGRDYFPSKTELQAFWHIFQRVKGTEFHHGDANGVDRTVARWVTKNHPEVPITAHVANWRLHGKRAGMIRNGAMLARVDVLVPFQGGVGTAGCTTLARSSGKRIESPEDEIERIWAEIEADHLDLGVWSD